MVNKDIIIFVLMAVMITNLSINMIVIDQRDNKQVQIDNLTQTINDSQQQISNLKNETQRLQNQTDMMNNTIIQNDRDIDNYKALIQYKDELYERKVGLIINPTYDEVIAFLDDDKTNKNEWTKEYDCTQFAQDVMRNALKQGIYSCVVRMDYDDNTAHNIIVFNTSDLGLQYFEPQTDENVYMYLGMDYAGYLGYSDDVSFIVESYDNCFERVI